MVRVRVRVRVMDTGKNRLWDKLGLWLGLGLS